MKIKSFQDLFETGLKYAYDCEQKLAKKGIPSMIKAASSSELRTALEQHLEETRNGNVVEHYEMAIYGSLKSYAQQLGHNEAGRLLQETLNEEKAADAKLTAIGERSINPTAAQERRAA
jgi:ferritin-like metal-binding protein YciE